MKTVVFFTSFALVILFKITNTTSVSIAVIMADWDRTVYSVLSLVSPVRLSPVLDMAVEEISHRVESGQYANFSLSVTYSLTGCALPRRDAVGVAARLYFEEDISALFGPVCSDLTLAVGDLAASLNLPMISFSANDHNLDDKIRFPTLTQTTIKSTQWCPLFLDLCRRYEWKIVVLLRTEHIFYKLPANSLEDCLVEAGIRTTIIHLNGYLENLGCALIEAALFGRSK